MSDLPARATAAEDTWVAGLDASNIDLLIDHAQACLDDGRPALAARVVGLLPAERAAAEPGLARARSAARLLLLAPVDRRGPVLAELEDAVQACRAAHMDRARKRHRRNARDVMDPTKPRRRPRGTRGR